MPNVDLVFQREKFLPVRSEHELLLSSSAPLCKIAHQLSERVSVEKEVNLVDENESVLPSAFNCIEETK